MSKLFTNQLVSFQAGLWKPRWLIPQPPSTHPPSTHPLKPRPFNTRYAFLLSFALALFLPPLILRAGLALPLDAVLLNLLCFTLAILFAAYAGVWQATTFALSAILCLAFTIPPHLITPLIALRSALAFTLIELTALLVSRLSASERSLVAETDIQRHRTQRLHSFCHNVLLLNLHDSPEQQIAEFIQQEFELDAVAIVSNQPSSVGAAGQWLTQSTHSLEDHLRSLSESDASHHDVSIRPLHNAAGPIGSLLILGTIPPFLIDSLASLASLALQRHRACLNESAADAARTTEQFRTTVLDGLAHAFKTPLTIIRAASSGLLEAGHLDDMQHQLIQMIDDQSEKLDVMTTRLLETAKAEGESLRLQLQTVDLPALVQLAVQEFRTESHDPSSPLPNLPEIDICIEHITHPISADHDMISSTLKELLHNAMKYSTVGSPITVTLSESPSDLTLSVKSHGEVIHADDHERIFDRFYRGNNHRHAAPGTGIGLSVARRVTEAHGGHIWVTSTEAAGTTFHLSLPTQSKEVAG